MISVLSLGIDIPTSWRRRKWKFLLIQENQLDNSIEAASTELMQSCLNDVFTGITENEGIFEEKDYANYISLTKGKKRVLV